MGIVDKKLFSSFMPTAAKLIDSYENQHLANVAWAYAVADVDAWTLFNDHFINACVERKVALRRKHSLSSINGICGRQKRSHALVYY